MTFRLENRTEAGQLLANKLRAYANRSDVLILALPRGGVPVGFEIARKLHLPLDVCLVRKLGVPKRKELAMGALGMGGVRIINQDVVEWLHIPDSIIDKITQEEQQELQRRDHLYRGDRPFPKIRDRIIILVDDGIATGSTLRAAIATLKRDKPKGIIVAVPVASEIVCQQLQLEVEQVICLIKPEPLHSISLWYQDFTQVSDQEVQKLLNLANDLPLSVS